MQKIKKINTFFLSATALLTAISIILGQFAVLIPVFGFPSVRFSVTGIPIFLVGSLFGGGYGAIAGFISDTINFMIAGKGAYHPGFTLNAILMGAIPGIIFTRMRAKNKTYSFHKINGSLLIVGLMMALVYINFIGIHEVEDLGEVMGIPVNVFLSVLMVVLVIVISLIVHYVQKSYSSADHSYAIDKLIFISIISFMIVQLGLTPIWLKQLYNIPITASIFVRVFKSMIDIPLQVMLLYIVFKGLPVKIKRMAHENR